LRKKGSLTAAFEASDPSGTGFVSRVEWADIMQRVTFIKIRWLSIINSVCPAQCLTPTMVDYRGFFRSFSIENKLQIKTSGRVVIDDVYGKRKQLETVFYFFDKDGDGVGSTVSFLFVFQY
jgi:Ca2+-binding EF-hand superfamily protein